MAKSSLFLLFCVRFPVLFLINCGFPTTALQSTVIHLYHHWMARLTVHTGTRFALHSMMGVIYLCPTGDHP